MKMSIDTDWTRCFLCHRKNVDNDPKILESSFCPASKKSIKYVINYLALQANIELHISTGEWVCVSCHSQIVDFDTSLTQVLRKQRHLSQLVEKSLIYVESDLEEECEYHMTTLEELNNDEMFNSVVVPDDEVERTMQEEYNYRKTANTPSQTSHPPERREENNKAFYRRSRSSSNSHKCQMCTMTFKTQSRLHEHTTKAHKKFSCEICNFSHRNEDYVLLHMNVHEGRNENQCRFCHKQFTTKISTIRHMEIHFNNQKYQCDKCGLCFSQTTVLYNHKLQHEAEEQPLRCDICQQAFKTKRTYRHHLITHQSDRPRYSCEFCAKTFTEKYTLKVHKRVHTQIEQVEEAFEEYEVTPDHSTETILSDAVSFNCIICDMVFPSKDQLNNHMEKEHDVILKSLAITNFPTFEVVSDSGKSCHICGHIFDTKTSLDSHLYEVHGLSI